MKASKTPVTYVVAGVLVSLGLYSLYKTHQQLYGPPRKPWDEYGEALKGVL